MRIGRIKKNGEILAALFRDRNVHSISSILKLDESTVTDQYYNILAEQESEILSLAKDDVGLVKPPWTYEIPIPEVNQIRDFYAFEEHVKAGRRNRGLEMIPEWYDFPVFYYSGTSSLYACKQDVIYPGYTNALDFELEAAVVIGREGKNIMSKEASEHIFGLFLMNDWSARDEQKKEMKLNLGPAKSKDFGTSIGPYIVAGQELQALMDESGRYDVEVEGFVNGKKYSEANLKSMHWSFGDMIERASREVTLKKGDIIMSGTVGTGCILELGPDRYGWLKRGDEVLFRSEILGELTNRIV